MKSVVHFVFQVFLVGLLVGCNQQPADKTSNVIDINPAKLPTLRSGEAVATVAGGCFWAVQEEMKSLRGVREAVSGYAGGDLDYPTYEQVGTDQTGHAEAVQIYYDPKVISYDVLMDAFFAGHDATQLNKQGPDIGKHYRSVAFYRTPDEKTRIEGAIRRDQANHKAPIVTQVESFKAFFPAEVYHQDYYRHNKYNMYITLVSKPKVEKFRDRMEDRLK
ncbi:peptide-methionine (S)-S-oxide reductase MsrA [Spirosoma endophyticum]|uniref:Peptide methionine sulfoxide reductase MsrA n=1 Tax=Spirosoma endophyticum TaxID=662367 RepID=A0A1I2EHK7_9BACT|nr:peptide-methionine (S)-S-oxide reductase MsrA [Spirosoma endophyticum]SFE92117.1 peptide-methionine (S)-S-oxide reductase [Spirosoma endophyticum]